MSPNAAKPRFLFESVTVTLASGLVAGLFGLLAAFGYAFEKRPAPGFGVVGPVGVALGAVGGVAVGIVWSRWLSKRALTYLAAGKVPAWPVLAYGTLGGGLAGTVSTLILHAGLSVVAARALPLSFLWGIGLALGVPAGLIVGFLGGVGWLVAMRRAARAAPTP